MAVITDFELVNTANVGGYFNDPYALDGSTGVTTVRVNGKTFVYVAGTNDDGITIFELRDNGTLRDVGTVADSSLSYLDGVEGLETVQLGGTDYLIATSGIENGVTIFRVRNDGTLNQVNALGDSLSLEFDGLYGNISVVKFATETYLILPAYDDDGIQVLRMGADGSLAPTDNLTDTDLADLGLNGAYHTATAEVGGNTYVFVTSYLEDSVTVLSLNEAGQLGFVQKEVDNGTLALNGAMGVETAVVNGRTFLFVGGQYDDGISTFEVNANGTIVNVANIYDDIPMELDGVAEITAFEMNGEDFLAVSGQYDSGLTILSISDNGILSSVATAIDTGDSFGELGTQLYYTEYNHFELINGTPILMATGQYDDGLSVFSLGGGGNVLYGTSDDDEIYGNGGADILIGRTGADLLDGGSGRDTASYAFAEARVTANLTSPNNNEGEADGDRYTSIENLIGSGYSDTLRGNSSANSIYGGNGNDNIFGEGNDDVIYGLRGNDKLAGDNGSDTVYGGAGKDELNGGGGRDRLYGQDSNDEINGGAGNDRLLGGNGVDRLNGGSEADLLQGGGGGDRLFGGGGRDRLEGGGGKDIHFGGNGADVFAFRSVGETRAGGATRDEIRDFDRGVDVVNLARMDANARSGGNQKFDYIGGQGFHGKAGELRYKDGVISGDTNGDRRADFQIEINVNRMSEDDFIL